MIGSEANIFQRLDNDKRYTLIFGGRGGAKSWHLAFFLVCLSYNVDDQVFLYTRYTLTSAGISIIPEVKKKISMMGWDDDFHIRGNAITNLESGTTIRFSGIKTQSGNQTAKLKSIEGLSVWVLDEAEEMVNREDFDTIDDSIRTKGFLNKVILVYNTYRVDQQHWIYKEFHQAGEKDYAEYIFSSYLDNYRNLAQSFIDKAERAKEEDDEYYQINYMGAFPKLRDAVFDKGFTPYSVDPEDYRWRAIGVDWGFTDPATAVDVRFVPPNNLYIKQIFYETGLTTKDIAEKQEPHKKEIHVCDSALPANVKELRQYGINAYPADKKPGSVFHGIQKLRELNIFIHADSKEAQDEWNGYRWKKMASGEYLTNSFGYRVPVDLDNHIIDPTRYVVTMMMNLYPVAA